MEKQEELERRIVYGLACEWDRAVGMLAADCHGKMRLPLLALRDLRGRLGSWSAEKREIAISRDLALNHPWDSVREVLLHEMGHQFRDEVFQEKKESPHGPCFQKACGLLRANPRASGRYETLDERLRHGRNDPRDHLMVRIKKLLALAESRNRHEAESAMAKAHELIIRYNVEQVSIMEGREFTSVFLGDPALRHSLEHYYVAHLLQDFYFVRGVWISAFVLRKGKMGRVLEISGLAENIKLAVYVFECVHRYIESQWAQYSLGRRLSLRRRTDFAVGIIDGFRSKLNEGMQAAEKKTGTSALVVMEDPSLAGYIRCRYPHLVTINRGGAYVDEGVKRDGERLGRTLVISRPLTEYAKGSGGLLAAPSGCKKN